MARQCLWEGEEEKERRMFEENEENNVPACSGFAAGKMTTIRTELCMVSTTSSNDIFTPAQYYNHKNEAS